LESFRPLIRNPHLLTILGNFARRRLDLRRFPVTEQKIPTEPGVSILVHSHRPAKTPAGEIVMVHGLEGSSNAGYIRSMSQLALEHGFAVHRTNMRSCGGTDDDCRTMYHAGLTGDTLAILRQIRRHTDVPLFLIGYSLGGNVALKLAGELGEFGRELLTGVVAVSTPIDLAACVQALRKPANRLYEWRFLRALRDRIRRRAVKYPHAYSVAKLVGVRSVYEFDDAFVAPFFGFGTADNYYATQSSIRFLPAIRVPVLLIQAKDDPMIPFRIFSDPRVRGNPNIEIRAVEHGGHLGFLADAAPRFWVDRVILKWITDTGNKALRDCVTSE
jgi:predicted alpha/beta-fold hydrolase